MSFLTAVSKSAVLLRQLVARYEDTVVKDPDFTSKLESTLKVASYIIPGAHLLEVFHPTFPYHEW